MQVFNAFDDAEWTWKYGYRGLAEYDLRSGGTDRERAAPEMVWLSRLTNSRARRSWPAWWRAAMGT